MSGAITNDDMRMHAHTHTHASMGQDSQRVCVRVCVYSTLCVLARAGMFRVI